MKKFIYSVSISIINVAFNLSLAKGWADRVPNWLVVIFWTAPLVPLAWLAATHKKVIERKEWLEDQFKKSPWRLMLGGFCLALIIVVCLIGAGLSVHKIIITARQVPAQKASSDSARPTPTSNDNSKSQSSPPQAISTPEQKKKRSSHKPAAPASSQPPSMSQDCAPGASCVQSNNQQGGVTAGVYNGPLPPEFRLSVISENVTRNGSYETQFKLSVKTTQAFILHVKAVAPNIVGDLKIDNERPPEEGGMAFLGVTRSGAGYVETDYKDIESGTYIITVQTSKPDKIQLEYH